MALGLTQPLTEVSHQEYFLGVEAAGGRADNLTIFMCRMS